MAKINKYRPSLTAQQIQQVTKLVRAALLSPEQVADMTINSSLLMSLSPIEAKIQAGALIPSHGVEAGAAKTAKTCEATSIMKAAATGTEGSSKESSSSIMRAAPPTGTGTETGSKEALTEATLERAWIGSSPIRADREKEAAAEGIALAGETTGETESDKAAIAEFDAKLEESLASSAIPELASATNIPNFLAEPNPDAYPDKTIYWADCYDYLMAHKDNPAVLISLGTILGASEYRFLTGLMSAEEEAAFLANDLGV